jgi:hypothetical protein
MPVSPAVLALFCTIMAQNCYIEGFVLNSHACLKRGSWPAHSTQIAKTLGPSFIGTRCMPERRPFLKTRCCVEPGQEPMGQFLTSFPHFEAHSDAKCGTR